MADTIVDVSISMSTHLGDRDGETSLLSIAGYGAFCRIVEGLWRRGGKLPSDPRGLQRLVRATDAEWAEVWPTISGLFVMLDETSIGHPRTTVEIERCREKKLSYIERGKLGGRPPKAELKLSLGSAKAEGGGETKAGGKTPPPPPPPSPTPDPPPPPEPDLGQIHRSRNRSLSRWRTIRTGRCG